MAKKAAAPRSDDAEFGDAVAVLDKEGTVIHTYSLDVHGDTFLELAQAFVSKEEGRTLAAAE